MPYISEDNGVYIYRCDDCGTTGRSFHYKVIPEGWTEGLLSCYCPRCSAKREAKDQAKSEAQKAAKTAKKQAAKAAQAAYDATPEGKKERNIAALSAVAAVLLFFSLQEFFTLSV